VTDAVNLGRTQESIERNYDAYMTSTSIAVEATMTFLNSFFVQFFANGYGLNLEVISASTKTTINEIVGQPGRPRPNRMIISLNEYYVLQEELPSAGYGGQGTVSLKSAFFSTLPTALHAFSDEGAAVIENYQEVMQAAAPILAMTSTTDQK